MPSSGHTPSAGRSKPSVDMSYMPLVRCTFVLVFLFFFFLENIFVLACNAFNPTINHDGILSILQGHHSFLKNLVGSFFAFCIYVIIFE